MPNKNDIPNFQAIGEKVIRTIPPQVAELAKGFFKGSFIKEGFTDFGFMPWPRRKDNDAHKILTKSQALRNSVKIQTANEKEITIQAGEGIPYAEIHNTGGTLSVPVTEKSRRFFWYMFEKTEDNKWKWMALTKKDRLNIYIPQRQYIGDSQTLMDRINNYFGEQIKNTFKP